MVAFDNGVSSLKEGKCDMALVAAINIVAESSNHLLLAKAGFLSHTGRCHSFDACADG